MVTKLFQKSWKFLLFILLLGILECIAILSNWYYKNGLDSCLETSAFEKRPIPNTVSISRNLPHEESAKEQVSFEDQVYTMAFSICEETYPDLKPGYVLALIYHESRFIPDVVNSKTGATGLMQILPKWHTARAEKLGVSLTDPAGNILTGCDILNEVYQQSGSMSYALNVYAGGYAYANNYKNTKSPFERELDEILASGVLYSIGR